MTKGSLLAAIGSVAILGLMGWSVSGTKAKSGDPAPHTQTSDASNETAQSAPSAADKPQAKPATAQAPDQPEATDQPSATAAPDPHIALDQPERRGPVTHLPLPRYVSLKGRTGNARRGPSLSHRIDWVFTHPGMPLKVTAEYGHWRRVEDRDGQGGWIHYTLISGVRHVVITQKMVDLHARADAKSEVVARAQMGAIARLDRCTRDWCEVDGEGAEGWLPKTEMWGVDPTELRD
ncbi:aspartyl-tRNA synthetase [Thioclava dalianensis]|uniref:Aspartyl-tRNA synthetase n=1 Tax=Thioclava dalianensis TaxID=1185766 RepID=A0A074TEH2_9RHOB|nr:aspartyl-tRNA synthetase [Thioclava dalianensis]SFM80535.1 SH3-like domain-containing protein [Thioclava dalianensis]